MSTQQQDKAARDKPAPASESVHRASRDEVPAPAKKKAPRPPVLVEYLAPPIDGRAGHTAILGARNIEWRRGPVKVFDNGKSHEGARVKLHPMKPENRGPDAYAMPAGLVERLIRQGGARVAKLEETIPTGKTGDAELLAVEAEEKKSRRERTKEFQAAGKAPGRQNKPERRRYGRQIFTVYPLRALEGATS